jgi:hypothetical protein
MPSDTRDVRAALLKKGFFERSGDHRFFVLLVDGKKKQVFTKISHSGKEIGENLLGTMARQMNLNRREFREFIECSLSGEDYVSLLRERHIID